MEEENFFNLPFDKEPLLSYTGITNINPGMAVTGILSYFVAGVL